MKSGLLSILFLLTILFSCTVTKREHLSGYHVEWRKRMPKTETDNPRKNQEIAATPEALRPEEQASLKETVGSSIRSEDSVLMTLPADNTKYSETAALPKSESSFSESFRAGWQNTVKKAPKLQVQEKLKNLPRRQAGKTVFREKESSESSRGVIGTLITILLLIFVVIPLIVLIFVISIALFDVQLLLWGLLILFLLLILMIVAIF
jgi:hypothetical protein